MKIIDENCLEEFRILPACEWCGGLRRPDERLQPHHIFSRGAGRLDIKPNLVGLCWQCHRYAHDSQYPREVRETLFCLVAYREDRTVESIKEEIRTLRQKPK